MPSLEEKRTGGGLAAARFASVATATANWISRLIDLSRRNNLFYYRPIEGGTIEIADGSLALNSLLRGAAVPAQTLLVDPLSRPARVLQIARKSIENLEEKGLETLYLAIGFASWKADDGGRDPKAPVLLLPLRFKLRGKDLSAIEVQVAGEAHVNPVLLHVLEDEFDVRLPAAELTESVGEGEFEPEMARFAAAFELLASRSGRVPEFRLERSCSIGNFAFQKLAMVNDLKEAGALLNANDVVAAIAGDRPARIALGSAQIAIDPRGLDAQGPEQEYCVVEADSSQQCAIAGIAAGQSAVVHGPPGTGKSQTITNLIATLIANGKTILFVAEKRAALEVVQKRLAASGLDHLAIDLHGAELSSKKVMERIARTLQTVRESGPAAAQELHRQFTDRRSRLNRHDSRMHRECERTGKTLFAMQGLLLRLPEGAANGVRWRGAEMTALTPDKAETVRNLLVEAGGYASLFTRQDGSPWTGALMRSGEEVQRATDAARRLAYERLPALERQIAAMAPATGFRVPGTLDESAEAVELLQSIRKQLEDYASEVYSADLSALLAGLRPAKDGGLKAIWHSLVNGEVKSAKKSAIAFRKGRKASAGKLYRELGEIRDGVDRWRALSEGRTESRFGPAEYAGLADFAKALVDARADAVGLKAVLPHLTWDGASLDELRRRCEALSADASTPYRILQLTGIESRLEGLGVVRLMEDIRSRHTAASTWVQAFDHTWLQSALDEEGVRDPEVRGFVGATHNGYVEEFKQLDSERLKAATTRVRRIHAERTIAAMNAHPEQEQLIKQEAAKTRRHKPLRQVFKEAREVMTAVCPCWMASPLSVSQLIDRAAMFDYVVFDEGSQILPEDAIPAIMRGRHVVVAGDNKQLPPTGFFSVGAEDEDDEESAADGYESLLDMMLPFAKGFHLNWHYRSKDEALIAFSNHHVYDDRLVTFPGPGGDHAISHVVVDQFAGVDGQEESAGAEVRRVVELVVEHARTTPARTLGVITMGIKHAMRIQGALDRALGERPGLADFFDAERPERFFVKNLERVQGDERDSIILSVGYGKDRSGHLPLRFGPILNAGGRRRLNVAVTRARETLTLVSSFVSTDIDLTKVRAETGLDFLRNYLQYAASHGKVFSRGQLTREPMNDFEVDVFEVLSAKGIRLVPQVGCSNFRLDFAVCHPEEPGRFVLAVECDGATYHSSYTARDRDKLRQQVLEGLGWTFHRIWSTDWFNRKQEEVERFVAAYEKALRRSAVARDLSMLAPVEREEEVPPLAATAMRRRNSKSAPIPKRAAIGEYTPAEMRALYNWVASDGQLRTRDEIADAMYEALPFARRGARIEAALRESIASAERGAR